MPKRATLLIIGNGLDHRAEDIRVDLRPVEAADMDQIRPRDLGKAGHVRLPENSPPFT